jgi:hypothetical protein
VQRLTREHGEERSHRAEAEEPEHDSDPHDRHQEPRLAHVRHTFAQRAQSALPLAACDREELGGPHCDQGCQHGEERARVDGEAPACADSCDQDAAERRADDLRAVLQADVERHRIRQVLAADQLVDERVLARVVEDERNACAGGQDVQERKAAGAGERHDGQRGGDAHREALREHQHTTVVEAVGEHAAVQAADHERPVAAEDEQSHLERRVRQLQDEPRKRRVLHPRAAVRDDLTREIEAVVAVLAEAREHPLDGSR